MKMTNSASRQCAKELATQEGTSYGMSSLDGRWYTGAPLQLQRIGVVEIITPVAEQFTLKRDNAIRPTKIRFTNNPAGQTVLFSGMDCLPGQGDLFQTDGEEA